MKGQFYKEKRHKLLEKVKDNSVVVLFAGNAPKKTADEAYPFTPNRNFYYLTGVEEPDHILLMSKINGEEKSILFIKDIDLELEKWIGKSLRENEALEIAGVDEVMFKSAFEGYIHRVISIKEDFNLYLDLERDEFKSVDSISQAFAKEIISKYPQVSVRNIYASIAALRLIKSDEEIENIYLALVYRQAFWQNGYVDSINEKNLQFYQDMTERAFQRIKNDYKVDLILIVRAKVLRI